MTFALMARLNRATLGRGAHATVLMFFTCFLLCGTTHAQTFAASADIRPAVVNSRVVTQAHNDTTNEDLTNVRVFSYQFQIDTFDPYFLNDPGFNAILGSGLPQSSQLNFNVLSSFRYWNGIGAVGFGNTTDQEQLRVNRGATNVFINQTSGAQNGFAIANVSSGGAMHSHLNTFLVGNGTNLPTNGIYFTAIDVGNTGAGIARSLPTYLIFNNGASAAALDAARNYVLHPLSGDVNFDGRVNTIDFNILASNFGVSSRNYLQGDLNENGTVDSTDFSIFTSGYGQQTPSASSLGAVVPEPSALSVILLGSLLLRRARRMNF